MVPRPAPLASVMSAQRAIAALALLSRLTQADPRLCLAPQAVGPVCGRLRRHGRRLGNPSCVSAATSPATVVSFAAAAFATTAVVSTASSALVLVLLALVLSIQIAIACRSPSSSLSGG